MQGKVVEKVSDFAGSYDYMLGAVKSDVQDVRILRIEMFVLS